MPTPSDSELLKSKAQETLEEMFKVLGSGQVSKRKVELAPDWIVRAAEVEKIKIHGKTHIRKLRKKDIPLNANVIGSHFVYKFKEEENEKSGYKHVYAHMVTAILNVITLGTTRQIFCLHSPDFY